MMTFFIVLFSAVMVLNSLLLMLLVLIQLPKKEAGAGLAFGGGATDALFGAGSGNVLTKITKWSAALFFILALILSVMKTHEKQAVTGNLQKLLQTIPVPPPPAAPVVTPTTSSNAAPAGTNKAPAEAAAPISLTVPGAASNAPGASAGTNAPKK